MDKNAIDVSQVFLTYMALIGDVPRVALALNITEDIVNELADREGWSDKVRRISVLSKSGKPGDYEKAQNRALNFVQAHQLRRQIDRAIYFISSKEIEDSLKKIDFHGNVTFTARVFAELTKAMQAAHEMTYSALGDSVKERDPSTADGEQTAINSAALHASLIGALNRTQLKEGSGETLVKAAVETVEQLRSAKP